jgi:hypothetical protein
VENKMKILDDVRRTDTKKCTKCGTIKEATDFYAKETRCKACVNEIRRAKYAENPEKFIARVSKFRTENPEKIRDTKLKQAYGVGIEYFDAKLKEQGNVCAGCGRNVKSVWRGKVVQMALDHCHKTGEPRGVLCIKCNRALGLLEESVETMKRLVDYVNKYQK